MRPWTVFSAVSAVLAQHLKGGRMEVRVEKPAHELGFVASHLQVLQTFFGAPGAGGMPPARSLAP